MTPAALWANNQRLAIVIAGAYYLPGSERQDVEQEALIALWRAARTYDPEQGTFRGWARFVINRDLQDCLRTATRKKHAVLSEAVRATARKEDADPAEIVERLPHLHQVSDRAESRTEVRDLLRGIRDDLSDLERYCVLGIASGLTYEQMGGAKTVDNALYRARAKLRARVAA